MLGWKKVLRTWISRRILDKAALAIVKDFDSAVVSFFPVFLSQRGTVVVVVDNAVGAVPLLVDHAVRIVSIVPCRDVK